MKGAGGIPSEGAKRRSEEQSLKAAGGIPSEGAPRDSEERPLDLVIVGGGPCGLAAAISAQRAGLRARVLDTGAVASTITQYPYYVKFFSTAEKLALGGMPFLVAEDKPTRREGLSYYRAVVRHFGLDVHQYERVSRLERSTRGWIVHSESMEGARHRTTEPTWRRGQHTRHLSVSPPACSSAPR